jgi:ketosteroid isomerase-like protein
MRFEERSVPLGNVEDQSGRRTAADQATSQGRTEARNMELMQTLDDAWNAQDVDVFRQRHKPDVVVRWPGQPEPTRGIEDHTKESRWFWEAFPDQHLDNGPYKVFFASGD